MMKQLRIVAAFIAVAVGAASLPGMAGSCIVSGETNRVARTASDKPMTGSLDSFWRDFGSKLFTERFLVASGFFLIVR